MVPDISRVHCGRIGGNRHKLKFGKLQLIEGIGFFLHNEYIQKLKNIA